MGSANAIYSSSDGGLNWQMTSSNPAGTSPDCSFGPMSFATRSTGWLTTFCATNNAQNLWVTYDGGVTWQVQTLPLRTSDIRGLNVPVFFDSMHGELLMSVGPSTHPAQLLL